MKYCSYCKSNVENVKFIKVPTCATRRTLWENILQCSLTKHAKICDKHFDASQWKSAPRNGLVYKRKRLNADAVPQRNDGEPEKKKFKLSFAGSSKQTQDEESTHPMAVEDLKQKLCSMKKEMKQLRKQLEEYGKLEKYLGKIFTETQIKILKNEGQRANFEPADLSAAISLHAAGPQAYSHLYKKGFPYPSRATLYRWLAEVKINPGTLDVVIDLMENEQMPEEDRLCVLAFDEMKVAAAFQSDSSSDTDCEPKNYVQLAIVRGLNKSWKQPVFFDFNDRMDVDTLHKILKKLHQKGYPVVAVVSDLGAGNQRLWSELGISETKTWFSHPADDNLKIYAFCDTPHLIKLIRNHYIDSGLCINGKKLSKETVQQAINHCAGSDSSILFKITQDHINVNSTAKQEVKLAKQLFSNTTASSIRRCHSLGFDVDNACETADLFKLVNEWFDVFNSKLSKSKSTETTQPYGKDLTVQRDVLAKMSQIMRTEIAGKSYKLPFQKGILVNNKSLDELFAYLSEKYGMEFIFTSRLNQDIVENFFGAMQPKGGLPDPPTPLQFKNRLRKYITDMTNLK